MISLLNKASCLSFLIRDQCSYSFFSLCCIALCILDTASKKSKSFPTVMDFKWLSTRPCKRSSFFNYINQFLLWLHESNNNKKVLKYFLTVYTNLICRNSFNVSKTFVCWFPRECIHRLICCLNLALLVCADKHSNSDSANDKSLEVWQPGFWPMADGN